MFVAISARNNSAPGQSKLEGVLGEALNQAPLVEQEAEVGQGRNTGASCIIRNSCLGTPILAPRLV